MDSISIFDIIKIGIGPSSSHTMGPWEASLQFVNYLKQHELKEDLESIKVYLFGSLAKTGKGHGTDFAITLGLAGLDFKKENTDQLAQKYEAILSSEIIFLGQCIQIPFSKDSIVFENKITHPGHPNAMTIEATFKNKEHFSKTFFSVGGGFVIEEGQEALASSRPASKLPCHSGADLLSSTKKMGKTLSQLVHYNENTWFSDAEINQKALYLWQEMFDAIWRGVNKNGVLPGFLKVKRRAQDIFMSLSQNQKFETKEAWLSWLQSQDKDFNKVNKWISVFALAVNEENASYGRVVTAPTNGAAGVIPSVLMYAVSFLPNIDDQKIIDFILTAGEIGTLFKKSATISAAMGGCQAEIGVSSAMAAAGLTEILGGTTEQVLMAAEIAMEHHLGLTCDPVGGLVQIPCIERNTMGSIKAITASNIALESNPLDAKVSLDNVIQTMWQTALDMNTKYKETSEAGLATNISVNIAEC